MIILMFYLSAQHFLPDFHQKVLCPRVDSCPSNVECDA